ncbi:MAG TPA: iron-containing alcohol dehydrogenase, partial [Hyphomicrobiaceae bacterium]
MTTILTGSWNYPTRVLHGPGRIKELAAACREAGMARPLLVTDEGLKDAPMIAAALGLLKAGKMGGAIFAGVKGNPTAAH